MLWIIFQVEYILKVFCFSYHYSRKLIKCSGVPPRHIMAFCWEMVSHGSPISAGLMSIKGPLVSDHLLHYKLAFRITKLMSCLQWRSSAFASSPLQKTVWIYVVHSQPIKAHWEKSIGKVWTFMLLFKLGKVGIWEILLCLENRF